MDQDHEGGHCSAFDFDIIREAFRKSVRELDLAEELWAAHAKSLFQDFTGREPDETMINHIIRR
ncbi:hypothetical protein [Mesorhizobium japonicum]|nr:hypothetical protein [Mesorhizobium japonicum]